MEPSPFTIGSPLHLAAVVACFGLAALIAWLGIRLQPYPQTSQRLRYAIALGCLIVWLINTVYWALPINFRWENSLPLHLCNLANLFGALAVWKKWRPAQSITYYWSIGLCLCAFLTPSLDGGITSPGFWVFWIYHSLIPVSITYVLVVDRFRPSWSDFAGTTVLSLSYLFLLAGVDWVTGWNYGFVGRGKPINPSLIDSLGPYPIRILWIALIGTMIFALLTVPWLRRRGRPADVTTL